MNHTCSVSAGRQNSFRLWLLRVMAWWNDYYLESLQGPGSQRPNTSSWPKESVMYTTLEPFQVMQEDFMRRQVKHGSRIQSNMPPREARQPTLVYSNIGPQLSLPKVWGQKTINVTNESTT